MERKDMNKSKKTKSKGRIRAVTVRRGIWRTNQAYRELCEELRFLPFDIMVMNTYDMLVPGGGATFWKLKATSNGSFFLFPEKEEKIVEVHSPNGNRACVSVEVSGIVATLLTLEQLGPRWSAVAALLRLVKYAIQQPEFADIRSLITWL
jgi:hypothetical protein